MKYQFQSNPGEFSYKPTLFTNAIKILISVNFGIFVLQSLSQSEALFFPLFGLVPKLVWSDRMVWQPFTYLFLHLNSDYCVIAASFFPSFWWGLIGVGSMGEHGLHQ